MRYTGRVNRVLVPLVVESDLKVTKRMDTRTGTAANVSLIPPQPRTSLRTYSHNRPYLFNSPYPHSLSYLRPNPTRPSKLDPLSPTPSSLLRLLIPLDRRQAKRLDHKPPPRNPKRHILAPHPCRTQPLLALHRHAPQLQQSLRFLIFGPFSYYCCCC